MADKFNCPHCKGKGKLLLTGVYLETLKGVRRLVKSGGHVVANRDAKWFGCNPTALNNRLVRLEELGFVTSERYGRQRRFKIGTNRQGDEDGTKT